MCNWCAMNTVLVGPKSDIERFVNTVNGIFSTEKSRDNNSFGPLWLGNIYIAFGYPDEIREKTHLAGGNLRGILDADFDTRACFCPAGDIEKRLSVKPLSFGEEDGLDIKGLAEQCVTEEEKVCVPFTVTSAWGVSEWIISMLKEKFPQCVFAYKATDEAGNFHICHNGGALGVSKYEFYADDESICFELGEEEALIKELKEFANVDVTVEELREDGGMAAIVKVGAVEVPEDKQHPWLIVYVEE